MVNQGAYSQGRLARSRWQGRNGGSGWDMGTSSKEVVSTGVQGGRMAFGDRATAQ